MLSPKNLFAVSVDPVIFSIIDNTLHMLLIKRRSDPDSPSVYDGMWALPGGLMEHEDGSMEASVARVLANKTGAKVNYMEQLMTRTGHDPRSATVAIAYIALVASQAVLPGAVWTPVEEARKTTLAFDHNHVLEQALTRLTNKVNYSTMPIYLMPETFTLPKLQKVYEVLLQENLSKKKGQFREKILGTGIVQAVGEKVKTGPHRPSELYRMANNNLHNFSRNLVR